MLEKIRNSIDKLIIELSEKHKEVLLRAEKTYTNPFHGLNLDLDKDQGFNNWLIHDYKDQGVSVLDRLTLEDDQVKNTIKNSVISVFRVHIEKVNMVFKDIVTGEDFVVKTDQLFESGDLVKVRLYPVDNHFTIIDNPDFFNPEFENTIRKSIMSQYNRYCAMNEPMDIRVFVKSQSQYIYHLAAIIDYYEAEMEDDESLYVYTVLYGIEDKEEILDLLLDSEHFQLVEQFEDETTIMLYDDGVEISEVLVMPKRLEIDANSSALRDIAKEILEKLLKDKIAKLSEEVQGLDDIL